MTVSDEGPYSPAERYLRAWHLRHPDASRVFIDARDAGGRSSYQRLASMARGSASILDIACGTGELLSLTGDTSPSAQLAGVDLAESGLRLARARVPRAELYVARAQALPVATASVDLVLCHMALMLMDDADEVLSESRRVSRSGGRFSAITNRPTAPDIVAKSILTALRPAWQTSIASLHPPPLGDPRTVDVETLTSLVSEHFEHVAVEQFDVVSHVPRHELWPFLADSLYGLDAIADAEAQAILDTLELPDPVPWTIAMVQVQGRA